MTTLPGNPHAASAKQELNLANPELPEGLPEEEYAERDMAAKLAQAHATLALAYEQRTANLIAAVGSNNPRYLLGLKDGQLEAIGSTLSARLGLTEGDTHGNA